MLNRSIQKLNRWHMWNVPNFWHLFQIFNFICFWNIQCTKVIFFQKCQEISSVSLNFMLATFGRLLWKFDDKLQFRIVCSSSYSCKCFISFRFRDISCQKASRSGRVEPVNYFHWLSWSYKKPMKMYFNFFWFFLRFQICLNVVEATIYNNKAQYNTS